VKKPGSTDWTKLNDKITGNPGYWVSRVHASHHDPGTAYVSYTGCRRDDFRPFVYKTTDYGETWTSIASNLPNGPINVIKEDHKNANLLFVGTDFVVYVSINGGKNWTKMKINMPTQPVHDLIIHPRENDLVVATHGRGIYITDISSLQELTSKVLAEDAHLFDVESKIRWVVPGRMNSSSSNFAGESEPNGVVIYYYLKNKVEGDVKVTVYKGNMEIDVINGSSSAGLHNVVWNMSQRRKRSKEEADQMRERMKRIRSMGFRGSMGDPNYIYSLVGPGEYKFVLTVGDKKFLKTASILQDHWYDK